MQKNSAVYKHTLNL